MLIRSQCRKQLVNFDNYNGIAISYQSECDFSVCAVYEMPSHEVAQVHLGNYSTEEKAIKVLDMIQNAYESSLYCDHAYDCSANVQRPYIFAENKVFQMPMDEEVK